MHIEVIGEVIIAMLAMYGVFCAIQLLSELFFPSSSFTLAVIARRGESVESVYKKLCYAQLISARERGAAVYPIVISETEEGLDELKKLGVAIYLSKQV